MPKLSSRCASRCLAALLALVAAGCSLTAAESSSTPVPTPERALATLEPAPTQVAEASAEPAGAVESSATSGWAFDCLSERQLIGQLLMPLLTEDDMVAAEALAATGTLGGVVLLGAPGPGIVDRISAVQQASFVPLLVASDEEGGQVQRLGGLLGPLPSASTMAATETPDQVQARYRDYGTAAAALGVDVIFAPVVDVGDALGGGRSFSADQPTVVTDYGRAVALGLVEAGVLPVLKHFPGHGRASGDSHDFLPVTPPVDDLRRWDLVPYRSLFADPALAGEVGVMVAHLSVPGLSEDLPTSLSSAAVNDLLRTEMGFGGVVFTDALNMGAIDPALSPADAVIGSIRAGSDVAILGNLNDVGPVADRIMTEAANDPGFLAQIRASAGRVLDQKGQGAICAGAE